jgi:GxxExxY protein
MEFLLKDKTEKIIKCFYERSNVLGYGFLEKVYENALLNELNNSGFNCESQKKITVNYKGDKVGEYYADILIDNEIILELKAAESLCVEHEYQLINYLKATNIELGLLLNFGKKPEIRRNDYHK